MIINSYGYPHTRYPITFHDIILDGSRPRPRCLIVLQAGTVFGIEPKSQKDGTNVYKTNSGPEEVFAYVRIVSDGPADYRVWVGGSLTSNLNQETFIPVNDEAEEKRYSGSMLLIQPVQRTTDLSLLNPPMSEEIQTGAWEIKKQRLTTMINPPEEATPEIIWPQLVTMMGEVIQSFTRAGLATIQQGMVLGATGTLVFDASCKGVSAKGFIPQWTTCHDVTVIPPTFAYMTNIQPMVAGMIAYNILPREVQSASGLSLSQNYVWMPRICLYSYKVPINEAASCGGFIFPSCVWTWESYCSGAPYVSGAVSDYFRPYVFYIADDGVVVTASKVMNLHEELDYSENFTVFWRTHAFFGRNYFINDTPLIVAIGAPSKYTYVEDSNAFAISDELQRRVEEGSVGDDLAGYLNTHRNDTIGLPIILIGMNTSGFPTTLTKAEANLWHGAGIPRFAHSMLNDDASMEAFYDEVKEENGITDNILVQPTTLTILGTTKADDSPDPSRLRGIPAHLHACSNIIFTIIDAIKTEMDLLKFYWLQGFSTTFYDECYRQLILNMDPNRNKLKVKVSSATLTIPFMITVGNNELGWPLGGPYTFKDLSNLGLLPIMKTYTYPPCLAPGLRVAQVGIGRYSARLYGDSGALFRIEIDLEKAIQLNDLKENGDYDTIWGRRLTLRDALRLIPETTNIGIETGFVDFTTAQISEEVPIDTLPRCGTATINRDFFTRDVFNIYALGRYVFYKIGPDLHSLVLDFASDETLGFPEHLIYIVYNDLMGTASEGQLDIAFGPEVTLEIAHEE